MGAAVTFAAAHFQNAAAGSYHQFSCPLDRGRINPILTVHQLCPVCGGGIEHRLSVAQDHFQHPFTTDRNFLSDYKVQAVDFLSDSTLVPIKPL